MKHSTPTMDKDADIYIVYFIALSYPVEYHVSFDLCGLIPSTSVCKVGSSSYICFGEPGLAITVHHQTSIDSPFPSHGERGPSVG